MDKTYSEIIFGKNLIQLTFDDISNFFVDEQEENSVLEFKTGDVALEKIYQEVTAFLNTQGGILIIGSPPEKTKGDKKICQGTLTNTNFKNKDWLSQKIISNIQPPPAGINIIERENNGTKVFVCQIEQSVNPPHQCSSDGKYYIRLEAEAKFAPHGIVLALFNKRKVAEIEIDLRPKINSANNQIKVTVEIKNKNDIPTDDVHYIIEVYNADKIGGLQFFTVSTTSFVKHNYKGKIDMPLIYAISFPLKFWFQPTKDKIMVTVYAWSKEVPLTMKYCIINSQTAVIEFDGNMYSEKTLLDAVKEVTE